MAACSFFFFFFSKLDRSQEQHCRGFWLGSDAVIDKHGSPEQCPTLSSSASHKARIHEEKFGPAVATAKSSGARNDNK